MIYRPQGAHTCPPLCWETVGSLISLHCWASPLVAISNPSLFFIGGSKPQVQAQAPSSQGAQSTRFTSTGHGPRATTEERQSLHSVLMADDMMRSHSTKCRDTTCTEMGETRARSSHERNLRDTLRDATLELQLSWNNVGTGGRGHSHKSARTIEHYPITAHGCCRGK
jgi:hypothetical protein